MIRMFSIIVLMVLFRHSQAIGQELRMPASIKTLPHGKCYWAYSIGRTETVRDSLHRYTIHVSVAQYDSAGKPRGTVKIYGANITCEWKARGRLQRAHFVPYRDYWRGNLLIHSNKVLPVTIVATFNGHTRRMPFLLNNDKYPGEETPIEEAL